MRFRTKDEVEEDAARILRRIAKIKEIFADTTERNERAKRAMDFLKKHPRVKGTAGE